MCATLSNRKTLPLHGRDPGELIEEMRELHQGDSPVYHRKSLTPAYYVSEEVLETSNAAFSLYFNENHIYSGRAYPSVVRYEADIASFLLDLMHAPDGAGGILTIGGSESSIMAVKAARDWARANRPGIAAPEMIVPQSIHPSFVKAAGHLGVKLVRIESSVDFRADVAAMRRAVNASTILLVASAPPFPYACMDPVGEIAELAQDCGAWMHVDCCLGGLFLPFAREIDPRVPLFDFRVPGVMSISADLHKYGYAVKGVSCLMFREERLIEHARFEWENGITGTYATPAIAGTRAAGAIASAWAVMSLLGREGYARAVAKLLAIKEELIAEITRHDGLAVLGRPEGGLFYVTSRMHDPYAIAAGLKARGWKVMIADQPRSIGLMPNGLHAGVAAELSRDLAEVLEAVAAGRIDGSGMTAVYGR